MFEGEEVAVCRGIVDLEVVFERCVRVSDASLLGPENLLAFFLGDLGPGEGDDCLLEVIVVSYSMLDVGGFDVYGGVKAV